MAEETGGSGFDFSEDEATDGFRRIKNSPSSSSSFTGKHGSVEAMAGRRDSKEIFSAYDEMKEQAVRFQ